MNSPLLQAGDKILYAYCTTDYYGNMKTKVPTFGEKTGHASSVQFSKVNSDNNEVDAC